MPRVVDEPRFALFQKAGPDLSFPVSEHRTFTEAETYLKALGRTGAHNDLYIVDKSKNVLADTADEDEQARLDAALATEKKRSELLAIQEQNAARTKALAADTATTKTAA